MSTETTSARPLKGTRIGVVVGDKRDKTRTVQVERQIMHRKYGKIVHRSSKFHVHDESNASHNGDQVEIANCRPTSKTKSWRLVRVIKKAPGGETAGTETGGN